MAAQDRDVAAGLRDREAEARDDAAGDAVLDQSGEGEVTQVIGRHLQF